MAWANTSGVFMRAIQLGKSIHSRRGIVGRFFASRFLAVVVVGLGILAIWYAGAAYLNAPFQHELDATAGRTPELKEFIQETWAQERPVLPVAVITTQPDHPASFRLRPRHDGAA